MTSLTWPAFDFLVAILISADTATPRQPRAGSMAQNAELSEHFWIQVILTRPRKEPALRQGIIIPPFKNHWLHYRRAHHEGGTGTTGCSRPIHVERCTST